MPTAYAPEANALVDVAAAVSAHDPVQQPCQCALFPALYPPYSRPT